MESLISPDSLGLIISVMMIMIALAFYLQKFRVFRSFGPVITVIIMGAVLSNLGIMPKWSDSYNFIFEFAVPVSLCLFLLHIDVKKFLKVAKHPMLAMIFGLFSICVVALVMGIIFAPKIAEGWKIAGMFIGTYTGGSPNLTAIAQGLKATPDTIVAGNAADYAIGLPTILIFMALPRLIGKAKWFQKFWPYSLNEEQLAAPEEEKLFGNIDWSIHDISILLATAFTVVSVCTLVTSQFSDLVASATRILLITTVSIIMAQFEPIKKLKGSVDLGFYICLFFLCVIGFMLNIKEVLNAAPMIALFCFCVVAGAVLLHLVLCRIFKIEWQYYIVSSVAAIWDGPTTAMLAGAQGWTSLMPVAIILGAFGEACGNYLGIGIAFLIKSFIGA